MDPRWLLPARSRTCGSNEKTLGGYPRVAGGSRRQADLTLGMAQPRDGVQEEQDVHSLVAEIFGDGAGDFHASHAQQRSLVAGADDNDAFLQAILAQAFLQEFLNFAAALADQRHDRHVGAGVPGDLADQRAFADAGTGKNSHALAEAAGMQCVDGPNAGGDRLVDVDARHGLNRACVDAAARPHGERRLAIDRLSEAVEYPAEQAMRAIEGWRGGEIFDSVSASHAAGVFQGHQQRAVLLKPDHLGDRLFPAEAGDAA